ncbi:MAG: hypothetical protein ACXVFV_11430, partial [Mycobacteriales bacterium]
SDALEQGLTLMPPTHRSLQDLGGYPDVRSALDDPREVTLVAPRFEVQPDGSVRFVVSDPAEG